MLLDDINKHYKFLFYGVPEEKQLDLMRETLLLVLHSSLHNNGSLLRVGKLSNGFKFEVYDFKDEGQDWGYSFFINKSDVDYTTTEMIGLT